MPREVEIARFRARSDSGAEYVIVEYQHFYPASSPEYPGAEVRGQKRLLTSDGREVNYIDPETFRIVGTDEVIREVR